MTEGLGDDREGLPLHAKIERLLVAGGRAVHFAHQPSLVNLRDAKPGVALTGIVP
jgi:hypothetical protein